MRIGALEIELLVSNSNSLKHKRSVIRALKDRIANNFNVSVAEVDCHDKWQRAVLGVSAVGKDAPYINGMLDKVLDTVRGCGDIHIIDYKMEIL